MPSAAPPAPVSKLEGIRLWRDAFNKLHLELANGAVVSGVVVVSPFPLSAPDRCVLVRDPAGAELGMIADLDELDPRSRALVRDELAHQHLTTLILGVVGATGHRGVTTWEFETERGPRTVHIKQRGDVRTLPGGRVLFTDVNGMRYEIPNMDALDDASRLSLEAKM
ncbi:hypothetical protein ENSA5_65430 [Enhygromyxa salina]|uniref:DUF1854 domain-containing protein n=1 Tax=Enhygromyxa salina TaxID=215803 RepID=A0A2S9XBX0_9BACT|nr:DUF1854 domain-containing protein [Enhygromyxa salina]PRP90346.1 hypothetical protein ENSA5_65430 [Enhygromyxa salina]